MAPLYTRVLSIMSRTYYTRGMHTNKSGRSLSLWTQHCAGVYLVFLKRRFHRVPVEFSSSPPSHGGKREKEEVEGPVEFR